MFWKVFYELVMRNVAEARAEGRKAETQEGNVHIVRFRHPHPVSSEPLSSVKFYNSKILISLRRKEKEKRLLLIGKDSALFLFLFALFIIYSK